MLGYGGGGSGGSILLNVGLLVSKGSSTSGGIFAQGGSVANSNPIIIGGGGGGGVILIIWNCLDFVLNFYLFLVNIYNLPISSRVANFNSEISVSGGTAAQPGDFNGDDGISLSFPTWFD